MCSGNMVTQQLWTALGGLIRQMFLFGSLYTYPSGLGLQGLK